MLFARPRAVGRRTVLALTPVIVWCACSTASESPPIAGPTATPVTREEIADVIYRPGTTDEGLLTLLNAPTVKRDDAEPVVTTPAEGTTVAAPATFEYRTGSAALHRVPRQERARPWSFGDWFTLERTAFAHGAPMNGDAFFLVFATKDEAELLRVFTQGTSYVPTDDEWQRLTAAAQPLTLAVTRAVFEQGRLTTDGGPFVGKTVHFTAQP